MRWRTLTLAIFALINIWLFISPVNMSPIVHVEKENSTSLFLITQVSPTITSPSTPISQQENKDNIGTDPSLNVAWISLASAILVALIGLGATLYQLQRNAKTEREKIALQLELERERIRYQDQIEAARADQERQRQRKEMDAEAILATMNRARNMDERVQAYRESLLADPRIARLQILDMSHPLDVTNVFVRVRLHQETKPGYELDPTWLAAEAQRDPNELLRASRMHLERRISTAIDPDRAICLYKLCVFVGDPGAGKTTLLKYLTLKAAERKLNSLPDLPIYIELNAFASSGYQDLLDFVSTRWDDRYGFPKAEARTYIEDRLKSGDALLLLDALDETVIGNTLEEAEASYKRVAEAITQAATLYHKAPIVVTARKAGYQQRSRLSGFTELEVLDFRPEDIKQFIDNWFACSPKIYYHATANDLNTRLARNPRLQSLASNPLLLSLIVIVYEDQLDLPDRRAELYKLCVDILLTKWDASRDILRRREFKPEHKRQLLEEVAWHFHSQGQRYVPENDLLNLIRNFLPIIGLPPEQDIRVLEEIAAENGLLKEQARHWYGFLHLTLQEYFVALYIADHQETDTLLTHLGDPWWEEVLILYAGHIPDATLLLQKFLEEDSKVSSPDDIFYTRLILAGRCIAARPPIRQITLRKTVLSRLFQALASAPYQFAKSQIVGVLAEIGGTEVNNQLLNIVRSYAIDVNARFMVINTLGRFGDRSVVIELISLLSDAKLGRRVRRGIISAIGQMRERSATPELVRLLKDRTLHKDLRQAIIIALRQMGEKSVAPELVHLLKDTALDKDLRQSILLSLERLGEKSVAPELVHLLKDTALDKDLRQSIVFALRQLKEPSTTLELMYLLKDTTLDQQLRRSIASAIGTLGEKSAVPELMCLLKDTTLDNRLRRSIASAIGALKEHSVSPELMCLLKDTTLDNQLRRSIASAIGRVGEKSIVPELEGLLKDITLDKGLRQSIVLSLEILGEKSIALELVRLLKDTTLDKNLHQSIIVTLRLLGEKSVAPELVRLLRDTNLDKNLRRSILITLEKLGEKSVVPELLHLLIFNRDTRDLLYYDYISSTLAALGEQSLVPRLVQLLNDPLSKAQRIAIASTLAKLGDDEETVLALASLLQTSDISNSIYSALWSVSRRAGVRVFITDTQRGKQIDVVKW